jgi:hypothetical protein
MCRRVNYKLDGLPYKVSNGSGRRGDAGGANMAAAIIQWKSRRRCKLSDNRGKVRSIWDGGGGDQIAAKMVTKMYKKQ